MRRVWYGAEHLPSGRAVRAHRPVRRRFPGAAPRTPRRHVLHIVRIRLTANARSFRRSAFPQPAHIVGLGRGTPNVCTFLASPRRLSASAQFSSSSFSTAINASVGICTLPRLRIFFLPPRKGFPLRGSPFSLLARAESIRPPPRFCLRQNACTRLRAPRRPGPRKARKSCALSFPHPASAPP